MPRLHSSTLYVSLLLQMFIGTLSIPYPNEIVGVPEIVCDPERIHMTVRTSKGTPSFLSVVNFHDDPECSARHTNRIAISHDSCGITRERSTSPSGIVYRACVAVQLHPQFVTKVDRTFCAQCVYMEEVREVDFTLAVSPQGHTEVPMLYDMPKCQYTMRRGSQDGEEVHYATVGEHVFHVWKCPSDMHGMLVQNCYVEDGQGNRILIIDQNGCGIDQYVLQTPIYSTDLTMAYQEAHVFKFADKTITRFTCQIKLCIVGKDGCVGITPPTKCLIPDAPYGDNSKIEKAAQSSISSVSSASGSASEKEYVKKRRSRREIWQFSNTTISPADHSFADDYQMDVIGEIHVLDSADDATFYEKRLTEKELALNARLNDICIRPINYVLLLVSVCLMSAMIVFGCVVCLLRQRMKLLIKNAQVDKFYF